jgi:hypothetical protein
LKFSHDPCRQLVLPHLAVIHPRTTADFADASESQSHYDACHGVPAVRCVLAADELDSISAATARQLTLTLAGPDHRCAMLPAQVFPFSTGHA